MKIKSLVILFLFCSCRGSLEPPELLKWIESPENGCAQEFHQEGYKLKASFLPANLMTYKQLHILEEPYDKQAFEDLEKEYEKGLYFKFSIDFEGNAQNAKQFFEAHTDYLNFFIGQDLALVMGTDTLACSIANLERSANFTPRLNYELAFDTGEEPKQRQQDLTLIYSGELSENKAVAFMFSAEAISDIPHLKR